MKIINGLIIICSLTQLLSATSPSKFQLDVGTTESLLLGDILDLNGKVLSGDKSKIDHYQWEENGKVLKNTSGNEIIYWDDANAENGYAPKTKGNHVLKFVVVDEAGNKHTKRLLVNVETTNNIKIEKSDLKFDLKDKLNLKFGNKIDINKGEMIPLSGIISPSKKHLVDHYRWELNGKVLKNQLEDEIIYWDDENRENDYVPHAKKETLKFIVTDINGNETYKELFIHITNKNNSDDYGNTKDTATKISLKSQIKGEIETSDDVDFFYFEVDKPVFIKLEPYKGSSGEEKYLPMPFHILTEKLEKMPKLYYRKNSIMIRRTIKLEPGKYYIKLSGGIYSYGFSFSTEDAPVEDDVANSMDNATEIVLDKKTTKITGMHDYNADKDFFTFTLDQDQYVQIKCHDDRSTPTLYKSDSTEVRAYRTLPDHPTPNYKTSHYRYTYIELEAGTYYVYISHGAGIIGEYSFEINLMDYTEDEIGDTKETAKIISPNTTIVSALNSRKDIDYFSIVFPKDGYIHIENIKLDPLPGIDRPQGVQKRGIGDDKYVHKGEKVFFKIKHRTYGLGYQPYKYELSFKEK